MSKSALSPLALHKIICAWLSIEVESFPSEIYSVYGQTLIVVTPDKNWSEHIILEHLGYTTKRVKWNESFHENFYIEWIFRSWIINRLEENLNIKIITKAMKHLKSLVVIKNSPEGIEESIFNWAKNISAEGVASKNPELLSIAKYLYEWCYNEELPWFTEQRLFEIESIKPSRYIGGLLVTMLDEDNGPFTRTELSFIERAIGDCPTVSSAEKAGFYLCRDWGLRPIQLSLLWTTDYGRDELGPYVRVPCVKGTRRSLLRRAESNFSKRYIMEDTATAVEQQIIVAQSKVEGVLSQLKSAMGPSLPQNLSTPLFPALLKTESRLARFIENPKILNYALHTYSHSISHMMRELTWKLRIPTTGSDGEANKKYLNITAYRFRRTKGTSMVLAGATPEEVAEALDHISVDSIKFYFRYNAELHNFINAAHAASPDLNAAVALWSGKILDQPSQNKADITVADLGVCTLGSVCPHHPTVTCYACPKFRPDRKADHRKALKNIESYQELIATSATGPITQQIEVAIYGAKALVLAILSEDDIS